MAFDLLLLDGQDLRRLPLEERGARLRGTLAGAEPYLSPVEAVEGDGSRVFEHVCLVGDEGVVSKRQGTAYYSGRSPHWLKSKNPAFVRP